MTSNDQKFLHILPILLRNSNYHKEKDIQEYYFSIEIKLFLFKDIWFLKIDYIIIIV